MPKPNKGESEKDFVSRCIPTVLRDKTAKDSKQAAAICHSLYSKKEEKSADIEVTKEFKYFAPVTKAYTIKSEGGEAYRYMEVTVSGTKEDRDGDMMSDNAVNKMVTKLNSGRMPFYYDHGLDKTLPMRTYRLKDMVGVWVKGELQGNNVVGTVKLNNANPESDVVWNYYQSGMPVAFSIGGKVLKKHEEEVM